MKRKITIFRKCLLAVCLLGITQVQAQLPKFDWAKGMGGAAYGADRGAAIAVDKWGNVYTTGRSEDTVDFDPGPGVVRLPGDPYSGDIYISKLNAAGNFVWARKFNGGESKAEEGLGIAVDKDGNVYTTGYFNDTVDFDPGVGVFKIGAKSGSGQSDVFISKLDSGGNFKWAKQIGGKKGDQANGITVDDSGYVYTTGSFTDTVDFDPGVGVSLLMAAGKSGSDVFVSKLDSAGKFIWAQSLGWNPNNSDVGKAIAVDKSGNVYTTGQFYNSTGFVFVTKMNASGAIQWTKQFGGASYDLMGYTIKVGASGNVYTGGYYSGTADFASGTSAAGILTATGYAAFISKLDASGNFVWVKQYGGTSSTAVTTITSLALDAAENIYTEGYFQSKKDFNPSTAVADTAFRYVRGTYSDIFVAKLDSAGAYKWVTQMGGTSVDQGWGIAVDDSRNIYTTGGYNNVADVPANFNSYDTASHYDLTGYSNIFVHKMSCGDTSSFAFADTVCRANNYVWNNQTYTTSGIYTIKMPNPAGCDSTITLNLTINPIVHPVITISGFKLGTGIPYTTYQWLLNGNPITGATDSTYVVSQNGTYSVVVTNSTHCLDTVSYTVTNVSVRDIAGIAQQIKIYPNPAGNVVYINAPLDVNIMVTGMEGKVVKQQANTKSISLNDLAEGVYLLRITDKDGNLLKVEKLIHTR